MNYRLLARTIGLLLILLGVSMSACMAFAWHAWHEGVDPREGSDTFQGFLISVSLTLGTGVVLLMYGYRAGRDVLRKEAIAIVGLGWLVSSFFGALPYMLCPPAMGFSEAVFESTSGFTTTGASVIDHLDQQPRSVLLWRALTQWLGGLGILVLFVALLSYLGVESKALFHHESSVKSGEGLQARIQDVAKRLWQIYFVLTLICCIGFILLGMSVYDAVCHSFTTLSTAGFSTHQDSIAGFKSAGIEVWTMLFMTIGGISFMLYAWLLRGRWARWRNDEESSWYLWIIVVCGLAVTANLFLTDYDESFAVALRHAMFQVITIVSTTGYVTADFDQWPTFSKVLLVLLMVFGGCAGSTAGGLKISRLILFVKTLHQEIVHSFRPNKVFRISLNGAPVDEGLHHRTVFLIALAGMTFAVGTIVVSLLEPHLDIVSCFASVVATLFNIGPGLGEVGATSTYAHLSSATHLFLCVLMIFGRLEFSAMLVLFMPSLWRKY